MVTLDSTVASNLIKDLDLNHTQCFKAAHVKNLQ